MIIRMRKAGTLLHISSLPGEYGIGNFGREARGFVDFLKAGSQSLWQVLPLGITGFGDSPYQSFSSFAGNPYFIDPEALFEDGLVSKSELEGEKCDCEFVDYGKLYKNRYKFLRNALSNFKVTESAYVEFCYDNYTWLEVFSDFMAIKELSHGAPLQEFEEELLKKDKVALEKFRSDNRDEREFWKKTQFFFYSEWKKLKKYANENGVKIIGDIPIYAAADSADVWEEPSIFSVDDRLVPVFVAGCPPDEMSPEGQLWGNPIYNWDKCKSDGYSWWRRRFEMMSKLYDCVRIDHFRGFSSYYSIPYGDTDAKYGKWEKGPGLAFFENIRDIVGETEIIAEDLGFIDADVKKLLSDCGFPGMKILEFGFSDGGGEHMPHNYEKNTVAYTGTHDNKTFMSFYLSSNEKTKKLIRRYLNVENTSELCLSAVRALYASAAEYVIVPLQDYISLGDEGRMNTPSTVGNNWVWRAETSDYNEKLSEKLCELASLYGRQ